MMSSMCSMITDRRTSSGASTICVSICSSSESWECVVSGWIASDFASPDVGDVREQFERVDHLLAGRAAALQSDDDERASFSFQIRLLEPVHRVARQAGVADPNVAAMLRRGHVVAFMAFSPGGRRLDLGVLRRRPPPSSRFPRRGSRRA